MGIDPKLLSMWTDADLVKEIERQNRTAEHHTQKAAEAQREAREIAAQLSMRHPAAQSCPPPERLQLTNRKNERTT